MDQQISFTWINIVKFLFQFVSVVLPIVASVYLDPNFFRKRKRNLEEFKLKNIYSPIVFEYHKVQALLGSYCSEQQKYEAFSKFLDFLEQKIENYSAYFPEEILKKCSEIELYPDTFNDFEELINFIFLKYRKAQRFLRINDDDEILEAKIGKIAKIYSSFRKTIPAFYTLVAIYIISKFIPVPVSIDAWVTLIFLLFEIIYLIALIVIGTNYLKAYSEYSSKFIHDLESKFQKDFQSIQKRIDNNHR